MRTLNLKPDMLFKTPVSILMTQFHCLPTHDYHQINKMCQTQIDSNIKALYLTNNGPSMTDTEKIDY